MSGPSADEFDFAAFQCEIDAIGGRQRRRPHGDGRLEALDDAAIDEILASLERELPPSMPDESHAGRRCAPLLDALSSNSDNRSALRKIPEGDVAGADDRSNFGTAHSSREWSIFGTDETPQPLSNFGTARLRRSDSKDRKTLAIVGDLARAPLIPLPAPLVGNSTTPFSPPQSSSNDNLLEAQKAGAVGETAKLAIPVWELTHDRVKITFANRALASEGTLYAWTLNLGPKVLAAAQRHDSGFSDYMRRGVSRALKRELGQDVLLWFAVDTTSSDRLHLHGGIAATDNELPTIEQAMCRAGGEWDAKASRHRQCEITLQTAPDGWVTYALRNVGKVKGRITGKPFSITNPLRARAEALYGEHRVLSASP
jgi:hypothetical protein